MKTRIISLTLVAAALALVAGAVADTHRKLNHLRASSDEAWREIAAIQEQRVIVAKAALNSVAGSVDPQLLLQLNDKLQRSTAMPARLVALDDPAAINAYKQGHGELTGALFVLTTRATVSTGPLEQLRTQLPREEAALADARERYREASAAFNARNRGALAALLRYRPLEQTL
ncbi:hypothetical protein [Massilia sp. CF038]|uniref:hypothetical protein n=1 Tax=Massilia sp. CF038 TaxID=1881045 RepID=UPI000910F8F4|nr:hypothetical protein [Massilia sp. CF038]SHH19465.1 Uncharacterized conserved protein [Massilia sp. CF038]